MKSKNTPFACLLLSGVACGGPSSGPIVEGGKVLSAGESDPVVAMFCDDPPCDGQTGQGPELGQLRVTSVSLEGEALTGARVEDGQLVTDHPNGNATLTGKALEGAILWGPLSLSGSTPGSITTIEANPAPGATPGSVATPTTPGSVAPVEPRPARRARAQYRIVEVKRVANESAALASSDWHNVFEHADHSTHVYSIERKAGDGWVRACPTVRGNEPFADWAIPVGAVWNDDGARVESDTTFIFGCMNGAIAKCYRWGYRPWVDESMRVGHQSCTRMARADYCGDGESRTSSGVGIYIQDFNLSTAMRVFGTQAPGAMSSTEAIWGPDGAYCASQRRLGTDWPGWQGELAGWCGDANAYGKAWQTCELGNPTAHGVESVNEPYLANKSKLELGLQLNVPTP